MTEEHGSGLVNVLSGAYFAVSLAEITAELFQYIPVIVVAKPLMPLMLMAVYFFASKRRHALFFVAMAFSVVTNLLFIPTQANMLLYGLIAFSFHRVFQLALIVKLVNIRDYIPVAIATIPFLLLFFFLLASSEVPQDSFWIMVFQNVLISLFGGIALSNYIMHDNRKNSWLLICGLLFVSLQFIVFIEKYYLLSSSPTIFRPIAMGLNAFAFYTFYEFVVATEKSDDNSLAA
jgi:hypothetical protein